LRGQQVLTLQGLPDRAKDLSFELFQEQWVIQVVLMLSAPRRQVFVLIAHHLDLTRKLLNRKPKQLHACNFDLCVLLSHYE
jgi:hypothetical protein